MKYDIPTIKISLFRSENVLTTESQEWIQPIPTFEANSVTEGYQTYKRMEDFQSIISFQ